MADIDADLEFLLRRVPVTTMDGLNTLNDDGIAEGYRDGRDNEPCGDNRSRSYWHGWRNGMVDGGHAKGDWASALLVKAYCEDQQRPRWGAALTPGVRE